jgi:hypothetical protein
MPLSQPRLRQRFNDCVVIVFCYITGEDESHAFCRFCPYLSGEAGVSRDALTSCLKEAGYALRDLDDEALKLFTGSDGSVDGAAFKKFWDRFQGEAVMFYTSDSRPIAHAVFVRSGGIVIDPESSSPEEGEFTDEHFKRVGGEIRIKSVSIVTRMSPQKVFRKR